MIHNRSPGRLSDGPQTVQQPLSAQGEMAPTKKCEKNHPRSLQNAKNSAMLLVESLGLLDDCRC
jgi:hypothetical protein